MVTKPNDLAMNSSFFQIILVLLALFFAACAQQTDESVSVSDVPAPTDTETVQHTTVEGESSPQNYETVGVVTSIMANKKFVVINHETIPGFMDGMTMPFAVADPTVLQGIQPGDSITFRFTPTGGIHHIEKVK